MLACRLIGGIAPPSEEMESIVQIAKNSLGIGHAPCLLGLVVKIPGATLCRTLNEYELTRGDGIQRTGFDFLGLVRRLRANLAVFGYMDEIFGSRPQGNANLNAGTIA